VFTSVHSRRRTFCGDAVSAMSRTNHHRHLLRAGHAYVAARSGLSFPRVGFPHLSHSQFVTTSVDCGAAAVSSRYGSTDAKTYNTSVPIVTQV
jgi:hypothetical protein